jgi:hypothetical protein
MHTPFWRIFARSVGSIGSWKREPHQRIEYGDPVDTGDNPPPNPAR